MVDEAILQTALSAATTAGAAYAEARSVATRERQVSARDGTVDQVGERSDAGYSIRVAVREGAGGWGFAATADPSPEAAARAARAAVEIARASASMRRSPFALDGLPTERGDYLTAVQRDPFQVPIEDAIDLVLSASSRARAAHPRIVTAQANVHAWHTIKRYLNTLGADLHQTIFETEGNVSAIAQDDAGYTYRRSFGNMAQSGWEFVEGLNLAEAALTTGQEAAELVVAPWAPVGPQTVILGDALVALIIHESCGHPTEFDRVLGWEAAFAGTSFLMPEMLGNFRYGSPQVSIVADSTSPGGLGTFGWDDEGQPAQSWDLVRDGIFTGYLTDREAAISGGQPVRCCGRASSWARMPIVRMVNVSLQPVQGTLDDLIASVDSGILVDTPSSWSLDDKRMNFHFSAELCREIQGGKLGGYRKGAAFQARTPDFWGAVRAVGGPEDWRLHGFSSCAKGEPLQLAHVAHGAPPIIVEGLNIARG